MLTSLAFERAPWQASSHSGLTGVRYSHAAAVVRCEATLRHCVQCSHSATARTVPLIDQCGQCGQRIRWAVPFLWYFETINGLAVRAANTRTQPEFPAVTTSLPSQRTATAFSASSISGSGLPIRHSASPGTAARVWPLSAPCRLLALHGAYTTTHHDTPTVGAQHDTCHTACNFAAHCLPIRFGCLGRPDVGCGSESSTD